MSPETKAMAEVCGVIEEMANLHTQIITLRSALDAIDMEANGALNNGFADCHAVLVTIQGIAGRALAST